MQERFMLVSRAHEGPGSDLSILSREEAEKFRETHTVLRYSRIEAKQERSRET